MTLRKISEVANNIFVLQFSWWASSIKFMFIFGFYYLLGIINNIKIKTWSQLKIIFCNLVLKCTLQFWVLFQHIPSVFLQLYSPHILILSTDYFHIFSSYLYIFSFQTISVSHLCHYCLYILLCPPYLYIWCENIYKCWWIVFFIRERKCLFSTILGNRIRA